MTQPAIVDFRDPGRPEEAPIDAARRLDGEPHATVDNRYSDPGQRFHCGTWTSTRGRWRIAYTEHEFCYLLEGHVRLVGDDGSSREFRAGDAFVIPAGFNGTWETIEPARKHYVIYEPAAEASGS